MQRIEVCGKDKLKEQPTTTGKPGKLPLKYLCMPVCCLSPTIPRNFVSAEK